MNNPSEPWTENDSELYRELASVAVPDREEQLATVLAVLPFSSLEPFRVVELGSGISFDEALGFVTRAIAERESGDLPGAES